MKLRPLMLSVTLLFLAGCVDISVNTTVKGNGSGLQKWTFTTTALLSSQIKNQVQKDPFFSKANVKISDQFKEGDYILTAEIPFHEVKDLENEDREVQFERSGFLTKTYTYTEKWKRSSGQLSMVANQARGFVPVNIQITVEMPGKVVESNADSFEGGIAKWKFPVTDLTGSKTLKVKSKNWNALVLIPLVTLTLVAIGSVAYLAFASVRHAKRPAVVRCSSCGASVATGSVYCNACGARL